MKKISTILMISLVLSLVGNVIVEAVEVEKEDVAGYCPYVKGYPQRVLFGDTHLHTSISNDAFGAGNRCTSSARMRQICL